MIRTNRAEPTKVPFQQSLCRNNRVAVVILLAVCLGLFAPISITAQAKSPLSLLQPKPAAPASAAQPAPAPQSEAPGPIPLPDVSAQSQQLSQTLRDIAGSLPSPDQLKQLNDDIKSRQETLASKQQETYAVLEGTPSSLDLREYDAYWRGAQSYSDNWNRQLLGWANAAQAAVNRLNQLEPQWAATLQANQSEHDLGSVLDLIRENLASLHKLRVQANDELQLIVKMQIASGALDQMTSDVLARLTDAQVKLKGHILDRDSLPLWRVVARRQTGESPAAYNTARSRMEAINEFAAEHSAELMWLLVLLVASLIVSYRTHRAALAKMPGDESQAVVLTIILRWISVGTLPALLLSFLLAPTAPISLIGIFVLLAFVPILRLLPPLIEPRFRLMLYAMAGVYTLNVVVGWNAFSPVTKREVGFLSISAIFVVFAYLVRPKAVRLASPTRLDDLILFGIRVAVTALGLSVAANLFGYMKLSQYLSLACIYSSFIAVAVFTGWRVFCLLLDAGLDLPQAQNIALVRLHRQALERWLPRILKWGSIFIWVAVTLDLTGAREPVTNAVGSVLNFPIAGAGSSVTLGTVLGFFVILVGGYAVSSAIRFLFREELLARFHLSRGLPELLSTTLHYLMLVLVFLYAVKVGQVELNRFTVLTGALGVGVGFGLQNIINNFVSGLILQFERPIHIGDVLELEPTVAGTVTRIGIRSSTILTAQGAEIIVPNANLISNRVTNWTLTEAQRRVELPVGVAYGSDLKTVMRLIYEAAATHPDVLTDPPPVAYFKQFGDSSLDFELQFWVMIQSNWIRVKSDVAVALSKAFEKAGIEIPFPQRDLHVRSIDPAAAELITPNGSEPGALSAEAEAGFDLTRENAHASRKSRPAGEGL